MNRFLKSFFFFMPEGDASGSAASADDGTAGEGTKNENQDKPEFTEEQQKAIEKMLEENIKKSTSEIELSWQKKFDRKNTELQKAQEKLEEEQKKHLNEKELAELEKQKERETWEKEKLETEKSKRELWQMEVALELELPKESRKFLPGQTKEEIIENGKTLKGIINKEIEKVKNEILKGGHKPNQTNPEKESKKTNQTSDQSMNQDQRLIIGIKNALK